jgi:hypothetical protein
MPVQGRTRKQLRQSIGYNLGAIYVSSASGNGDTTSLIDNTLIGGNDNFIGYNALFTSGNNDGALRRVSDFVESSTDLTVSPALSNSTATNDTYELWEQCYHPNAIHDFINQAIIDTTGQAYDPIENPDMSTASSRQSHTGLHADGTALRFDIPSNISIINHLYYRSSVSFTRLHSCNAAFDETVDSDITASTDTQDKKQGTASAKFVVAGGASAGDIATDSITSKDISKYDYLECWVKSTVATSAGNLKILLDDSASCASPLETLSVPALSADTWTYVRMQLSNPELNTAIISIGLEYDADIGACQVRLDDIKVVQNDSAVWEIFPKHLWKLDRSARDLIITQDGKFAAGYSLLKITGGDKPSLLSTDSATTEIDDSYIIARATGLAFASASGGPSTDPDQLRQQAAFWLGLAEQAKRAFPLLITGRAVE